MIFSHYFICLRSSFLKTFRSIFFCLLFGLITCLPVFLLVTILSYELRQTNLVFEFKYFLELCEADLTILGDVMSVDHFTDIREGHLSSSEALKNINQVVLRYELSVIDIKLFEQSPQHLFCQCLFDGKCGSKKLSVVDFAIANVVYLLDDLVNLSIGCSDFQVFHGFCQLVSVDKPASIKVKLLELESQLFYLLLERVADLVRGGVLTPLAFVNSVLDEQIECSFFKLRDPSVTCKLLEHVLVQVHIADLIHFLLSDWQKVGVIESVFSCDTQHRLLLQELNEKVFGLIWDVSPPSAAEAKLVIPNLGFDLRFSFREG